MQKKLDNKVRVMRKKSQICRIMPRSKEKPNGYQIERKYTKKMSAQTIKNEDTR